MVGFTMLWMAIGCGAKFSLYDGEEIQNQAPIIEAISLTPSDVSAQTEVLTCQHETTDPDDDPFTVAYNWQLNGSSAGVDETLDGPFVIGDAISCTIVATDSEGNESIPAQTSTLILNSPPTVDIISIGPRPLMTNDIVRVQAEGADLDVDQTVSLTYEWHVVASSGADMMVQTGPSLSLDGEYYFEKGDSVYAIVTPNDGEIAGESAQTEPLIVANAPPLKPIVTIVSIDPMGAINTEPIEGEDLQCMAEELVDIDGDLVLPEIRWKRNGSLWNGAVYDANYIGDTIDGADTVAGDIWSCQWIARDPDNAQSVSNWTEVEILQGFISATCADIMTTMDMWGGPATGVDLRAWTNSTLHYIGCNGDGCGQSSFSCVDDPVAETLEFGTSQTLRAVVDPNDANGDIMPTSYAGCCNGPMGLCNAFDNSNNGIGINGAEALCFALGYASGSIVSYVSSNTCPEVHANSIDGLDWGSDFINSDGYGNKYRCEGFR